MGQNKTQEQGSINHNFLHSRIEKSDLQKKLKV